MVVKKSENKAIGLTRGGINTKVHAVVDGLGNPVEFLLSPGNDHDSIHAIKFLDKVDLLDSHVLADRAYGTAEIRDYIESRQAAYVIPRKSNSLNPWDCDWWRYKGRHLVECFYMRSATILFLPLFTLLPLPCWSNSLNNAIFQTRPNIGGKVYAVLFILKTARLFAVFNMPNAPLDVKTL